MSAIDIDEKFALIDEHWRPKVAARLNGQEVKLVKVQACFRGTATPMRTNCSWFGKGAAASNTATTWLPWGRGEMAVVPRGVEHRTAADEEALVLIFEPVDVRNTGDVIDASFTAPDGVEV